MNREHSKRTISFNFVTIIEEMEIWRYISVWNREIFATRWKDSKNGRQFLCMWVLGGNKFC